MRIDQNGENIVPFSGVRTDMKFPAVSEIRAYWEALRNGRMVPLRSEIDPRGIERALEYAFILERIAPGVTRFRLAGMHLGELMGMEVRGMPLTTFFVPEARAAIGEIVEDVFRQPQIAELTLAAETGFGKPPLQAKLIVLPLQSDLGDITRAIGCLSCDGATGRAPRRFAIMHSCLTAITPWRSSAATLPARGFAETPLPFAPASQTARSHLRLVKTDR